MFNFAMVKWKWYTMLTGIYKPLGKLYHQWPTNTDLNKTLNQASHNWYNTKLFYAQEEYKLLDKDTQKSILDGHDRFYGRMYYEVEYHGKLEYAKTFQSFYFFFRQLFSACWLTLVISLPLFAYKFFISNHATVNNCKAIIILHYAVATCMVMALILAQWYRKRMVYKMYWSFYTHINQTLTQK